METEHRAQWLYCPQPGQWECSKPQPPFALSPTTSPKQERQKWGGDLRCLCAAQTTLAVQRAPACGPECITTALAAAPDCGRDWVHLDGESCCCLYLTADWTQLQICLAASSLLNLWKAGRCVHGLGAVSRHCARQTLANISSLSWAWKGTETGTGTAPFQPC